jgi:hypothetical protein
MERVFLNRPVCGFYTMTLVKKGPLVPVEIRDVSERDYELGRPESDYLMEDQRWIAVINGEEKAVEHAWPWCSKSPITEAEYRYLLADARHAADWRPDDPKANPRKAIDLLTSPIPF